MGVPGSLRWIQSGFAGLQPSLSSLGQSFLLALQSFTQLNIQFSNLMLSKILKSHLPISKCNSQQIIIPKFVEDLKVISLSENSIPQTEIDALIKA